MKKIKTLTNSDPNNRTYTITSRIEESINTNYGKLAGEVSLISRMKINEIVPASLNFSIYEVRKTLRHPIRGVFTCLRTAVFPLEEPTKDFGYFSYYDSSIRGRFYAPLEKKRYVFSNEELADLFEEAYDATITGIKKHFERQK